MGKFLGRPVLVRSLSSNEVKGLSSSEAKEATWFVTLNLAGGMKSLSKQGGREFEVRSKCSIAALVQNVQVDQKTQNLVQT
jgi:hypothetical protein